MRKILRKVGSKYRLAKDLGISTQAVYQWRRIPVEHVLKIEEMTGVTRYEMRPDIYGKGE
ncbi:MAG: hypothetical protein GWN14_29285 [candidate division Zixibacteria bacterium]|nr:hypothetical protein [Gammaproteobacteria bacterium]NIX59906.1 hypothetical protein [candidate division Zixibacteria bacterium]